MLPHNWHSMTRDEQDTWSLERWLHEAFPAFTFVITFDPAFNIHINEDGANLSAVQASADAWFYHAYGTHVAWKMRNREEML